MEPINQAKFGKKLAQNAQIVATGLPPGWRVLSIFTRSLPFTEFPASPAGVQFDHVSEYPHRS
jgi:hypothetical protein